jgi:hypothetical protein
MASAKYDKTSILLREAIQNSCDAKTGKRKAIDFTVALEKFSHEEKNFLKTQVFRDAYPSAHNEILQYLNSPIAEYLVIADQGTTGLDGFLDPSDHSNYGNFLKFFFVYGSNDDKDGAVSGGAAGVGRTIFFNTSKANTILVGTRVMHEGKMQTRFMAATSGEELRLGSKFLTGRHWWGNVNPENEFPLPVVGQTAENVLQALGLSKYLPEGQTGTLVAILGPTSQNKKLSESSNSEFEDSSGMVEQMARAAEIFAWPHILDATVNFKFQKFGNPVQVRDPNTIKPIRYFCIAYKNLGDDKSTHQIRMSDHGKKYDLGTLAHTDWPDDDGVEDFEGFTDFIPKNSVALMRQAKFVVKYMPIESRSNGIATRAVFLAQPGQADRWFRDAEPAAHDDWLPEKLGIPAHRAHPIKLTFRKIREFFSEMSKSSQGSTTGKAAGDLARLFGTELEGAGSWGPEGVTVTKKSGTSTRLPGSKKSPATLADIGSPRVLKIEDGKVNIEFLFQCQGALPEGSVANLEFETQVLTSDGTVESAPPLGEERPKIIEIRSLETKVKLASSPSLTETQWKGDISVIVEAPNNALIQCEGHMSIVFGAEN